MARGSDNESFGRISSKEKSLPDFKSGKVGSKSPEKRGFGTGGNKRKGK